MGNPGTGKTTVARLLAKIYHAVGVLSKRQLVEGAVGPQAVPVAQLQQHVAAGVDKARFALAHHPVHRRRNNKLFTILCQSHPPA